MKQIITIIALLCWVVLALRQSQHPATPAPYAPTEIQLLRLQVKQRDAQLAQRDLAAAQQRFQSAIADLMAEASKVKHEQGWDEKSQFNADTLQFSAPLPEPPKRAVPVKPPATSAPTPEATP